MAITRRVQIITASVLLALGLAALAFAYAVGTAVPLVRLGSHSYLRMAPGPWWQPAMFGVLALLIGGCVLAWPRGEGKRRDDAAQSGAGRAAKTPASTQPDSSQALDSPNTWRPITIEELELVVAKQLQACSPSQQAAFASYRVPFYAVPVRRLGSLESALVVAELPSGLLYYEDVEGGFEVGRFEDGVLPDAPCQQFELTHVLHQSGF